MGSLQLLDRAAVCGGVERPAMGVGLVRESNPACVGDYGELGFEVAFHSVYEPVYQGPVRNGGGVAGRLELAGLGSRFR
jgi:hypothetical protein